MARPRPGFKPPLLSPRETARFRADPAKPVQISVDLELPRRIDADPETRERGRSAFVRSAVSSYLAAKRRRAIDRAIGAAYGDAAFAMEAEVSDFLDAQAWPRD